ncbi:MAG: T9SS type A sorting domain-containing protein [Bacteroidetes bacterium]|nr:T9SS type A sorting domain-containing protein [Bacteroidota bacterium]
MSYLKFISGLLVGMCFTAKTIVAQSQLFRDTIVVKENGQALKNPWAGGLNFCEVSQADLNLDGKKDLVIYDKTCNSGGKLRAFLNQGTAGQIIYKHAPYYQAHFPDVSDWALFFDYDNDGREDLFAYTTGGIKVYRNVSSPGTFSMTLVKSIINSNYNPGGAPSISNLYASPVGLPGIADIDGDGDLDVLSYSTFGIKIQYHKNMSQELYGHSDSLVFNMVDDCWGDIYENNCTIYLSQCPYQKIMDSLTTPGISKPLHAGSCIMCFDNDGDGDQDLLLGDIACSILQYAENVGSTTNAHIFDTTQLYPNYPLKASTTVARMNSFPCSYYVDIDNDGKKDLLASPNAVAGSENYASLWYYKNMSATTVADFHIQQKNLLQDNMIEVGEGAYPCLFDADADGKLDLLIGNVGYYTGNTNLSKIAYYRNTGTAAAPSFSLITRDYQNLTTYNLTGMFPTFADLDGDFDNDMIIGDFNGNLHYFQNTAIFGTPAVFGNYVANYFNIDVGNNATPQLVDVNKDGLVDLLIGNQTGKLTYYKNTGTTSNPNFVLQTASFGGVNVKQYGWLTGYSVPFLYNDAGVSKLLVGSEVGNIYLFDNIDGNLSGNFNKVDTTLYKINEGTRCSPFFVDVNNDGKRDLFLGNYAGGVGFFSSVPNTIGINELNPIDVSGVTVYPNPAQSAFQVAIESPLLQEVRYNLMDALGHVVMTVQNSNKSNEFNVSSLAPGFYVMQVLFLSDHGHITGSTTRKIIIH